ncbi:MAG TPA: L-histidine N(alpha)-methyltransferase [Gemmataceae bacterium]|jgi:dimethylhistidine N-methyltransferase|nr:L-histidine N(alpha)-methyltransferase [Gemmataceae bacterium]
MAIHGTATRPHGLNRSSPLARFRADVLAGLAGPTKTLPCKYLYDDRGSGLFDQICDLPEYYPTRTELSILRRDVGAMAAALGEDCLVIEYGSGSGMKTPLLLERLHHPAGYVPVEISRDHLYESASSIARRFPHLDVLPVWADFTAEFEVPNSKRTPRRSAVFFPGSTIGNFGPSEAVRLMEGVAQRCGTGGAFLVGVDLRKSEAILEPAYDDAAGVTAAFNKNLLVRINRELRGDFDVSQFDHRAVFNEKQSRIEMHLVSRKRQAVRIDGTRIWFAAGESICTEHSYKYTLDAFRDLAHTAGLTVRKVWTDDAGWFSVQYLEVT